MTDSDALKSKALELFANGETIGVIAAKLGVSRTTLYNWRHDDQVFAGQISAVRDAAYHEATGALRAAACTAVEYLVEVLRDDSERTDQRLKAATVILAHCAPDGSNPITHAEASRVSPVTTMTLPEQRAYILRCLAHVNSKLGIVE